MDLTRILGGARSERSALMPAPAVSVRAGAQWFGAVAPELRTPMVDLLYVTDRDPVLRDHWKTYDWQRSPSLAFGSCMVALGDDLDWPTLVDASTTEQRTRRIPVRVTSITELGRFAPTPIGMIRQPDGTLVDDPVARERQLALRARFQDEVRRRLRSSSSPDVFVYVHGYRYGFERAARHEAEFWHSAGRIGVPILYSWPAGSPGVLTGYTHDRESSEFTVFHLKQLLRALAATPEIARIHVFAHSRGTDIASSALRELLIEERGAGRVARESMRIGEVVLASPDIDVEVVTQRYGAERFANVCRRLTIYVSLADRAIGWADRLFRSQRRLGKLRIEDFSDAQRALLDVIGSIDIIDFRLPARGMGHSYYRTHPAASSDVILALRGAPAGGPLRPLRREAPHYWVLDDPAYPAPVSWHVMKESGWIAARSW